MSTNEKDRVIAALVKRLGGEVKLSMHEIMIAPRLWQSASCTSDAMRLFVEMPADVEIRVVDPDAPLLLEAPR